MFQTDSFVFIVVFPFLSGTRFGISYELNNSCTFTNIENLNRICYFNTSSNIEHEPSSFVGNKCSIKIPESLNDFSTLKNRSIFNFKNFLRMLSYNPMIFSHF
ncbi:hypothetical protein RhiirC2_749540 [Rhizophagus irregularis]|uniref:Uncharacterized protein n=1 Tax=Rhizophagus irregularis TaxID=588596 RepID=A0A2N1N4L0_9GLOM|nr:hypothetical protein RhiirC2_749540 [Rhizophagus irregularis]